MKKFVIIFLTLYTLSNNISGKLLAQDSNDPIKKMYGLFLANSFNVSIDDNNFAISSIPVYLNNFSDCTLKDSTFHPDIKQYINFPKEIKARTSETGFIYYSLHWHLFKKDCNDLFIKYNFENSYRTPFVFHILRELPGFPDPPQSNHDGIKNGLAVVSKLIGFIPVYGDLISSFFDLITFLVFQELEYKKTEYPMEFYTLAYTYTNNKDIDVPQTIFYADSTGTPSTNACYMFHCSPAQPSDTAFVIEKMVIWPRKFTDYPPKNVPGYSSASIIINIYNSWEYFNAKNKTNAEMIVKYRPDYASIPKLKVLVDDLNKKSLNEIAALYSNNYNTLDAIETDGLLDDFYKGNINFNSAEFNNKLNKILKIHNLD